MCISLVYTVYLHYKARCKKTKFTYFIVCVGNVKL